MGEGRPYMRDDEKFAGTALIAFKCSFVVFIQVDVKTCMDFSTYNFYIRRIGDLSISI